MLVRDPDRLWEAFAARDADLDGAVFMAVATTRIYCRPACPARSPKRENVSFYDTPAAAEAAGYRACKRCRPEAIRRLPITGPYDWDALLGYLRDRAIPGVEAVDGETYRRVATVGSATGTIEVRRTPDGSALLVLLGPELLAHDGAVLQRVARVFGLDVDPAAVAAALGGDELLAAPLERRPGLRVPGAWEGFEVAVRAILGQQVTVSGATTLAGRLVRRHGEPLARTSKGLGYRFPEPAALVRDDIVEIGLTSAARGRAIAGLAAACADGLDLSPGADPAATRQALVALPGIGDWTAEYVAMRALRDPDAFPAADLGLRRALAAGGRDATAAQATRRAAGWRPWRSYAAVHLWQSLGDAAKAPAA